MTAYNIVVYSTLTIEYGKEVELIQPSLRMTLPGPCSCSATIVLSIDARCFRPLSDLSLTFEHL